MKRVIWIGQIDEWDLLQKLNNVLEVQEPDLATHLSGGDNKGTLKGRLQNVFVY